MRSLPLSHRYVRLFGRRNKLQCYTCATHPEDRRGAMHIIVEDHGAKSMPTSVLLHHRGGGHVLFSRIAAMSCQPLGAQPRIRFASFSIGLARPCCYTLPAMDSMPRASSLPVPPCKRATDVSGGETASLPRRWSSPNEMGHPQDRDAVGKREKGLTGGCPSPLGGGVRCRSKVGA